jgi:hypothetical protein
MGLIVCQKHGESGFCMRFSKRVIYAIESNCALTDDALSLFHITYIDDEDGEELYTETYLLLEEEFAAMNLPRCVSADTDDLCDAYNNALPELSGICSECFQEYKDRHGLKMLGFF